MVLLVALGPCSFSRSSLLNCLWSSGFSRYTFIEVLIYPASFRYQCWLNPGTCLARTPTFLGSSIPRHNFMLIALDSTSADRFVARYSKKRVWILYFLLIYIGRLMWSVVHVPSPLAWTLTNVIHSIVLQSFWPNAFAVLTCGLRRLLSWLSTGLRVLPSLMLPARATA